MKTCNIFFVSILTFFSLFIFSTAHSQSSIEMRNLKIGIIGAMEPEIALLRSQLQNAHQSTIAHHQFYSGKLAQVDVILLQSGIGKVNAAIGTTLLIQEFKVDYIINTGSAGGLLPTLNVGDVIVSLEVRHHDVDVTVLGFKHGQVPTLPAAFLPHPELVSAAERAAIGSHLNVKHGLIVSGDSFIHQPADVATIREHFSDAHAVEMEAAAISQVCHQFNIPFLIIRSISDIAGQESRTSFEQFLEPASKNSAEFVIKIIQELQAKDKLTTPL
jgi:adenosylhomocysteine nucleosidase